MSRIIRGRCLRHRLSPDGYRCATSARRQGRLPALTLSSSHAREGASGGLLGRLCSCSLGCRLGGLPSAVTEEGSTYFERIDRRRRGRRATRLELGQVISWGSALARRHDARPGGGRVLRMCMFGYQAADGMLSVQAR